MHVGQSEWVCPIVTRTKEHDERLVGRGQGLHQILFLLKCEYYLPLGALG